MSVGPTPSVVCTIDVLETIHIAHSLGRFPSMLEQYSASHWLHCGHTTAYWVNFMALLVTLPLRELVLQVSLETVLM